MGCTPSKPSALVLPQHELPEKMDERKKIIADNGALYEWDNTGGSTPPHIKKIPDKERSLYTSHHHTDLIFDIVGSATRLGIRKFFDDIGDLFRTEGAFQDYSDVYSKVTEPHEPAVAQRWRDDEEFARQRLQGTLPTCITLLTAERWVELKKKFPVTDDRLARIAGYPDGKSIDDMIAAKALYFVDYTFLDGIRAPPERHCYAPIALFYVRKDKKLMPAAIQLKQQPDAKTNPVIMPYGDDVVTNRWLVAKMLFNSAEGCLHEASNHLLSTHLVMEIVYVALKRTTAPTHPLHEIIAAHFWYTLIINEGARTTLMVENGAVPVIMAMGYPGMVDLLVKGWAQHTFEVYNVEKGFEERGVTDEKALPGYYYRDDSLRVWKAINKYVRNVVTEFYKTDKDVVEDSELQAFVAEMVDPAKGNLRGTAFKDGKATTVEQVILFTTHVIWASSAYHAALNNGQYDYFGYVPNAPGVLKLANPAADASYTIDEVAKALPNAHMTSYQISFIHVLSTPTDEPLGHFKYERDYLNGNEPCLQHLKKFQAELEALSKSIASRNKNLEVPYTYLDPKQIASGIAI